MVKKSFRKDIRLPNYDYSSPGWYFVTICTNYKNPLFAPSVSNKYKHEFIADFDAYSLKEKGNTKIVEDVLISLEKNYYNNLIIDFYALLADHIHLVIVFEGPVKRRGEAIASHYTLGKVVGAFKALTSMRLGFRAWQPNYYERIIRTEGALERIRQYILRNPDEVEFDWKHLDPLPV